LYFRAENCVSICTFVPLPVLRKRADIGPTHPGLENLLSGRKNKKNRDFVLRQYLYCASVFVLLYRKTRLGFCTFVSAKHARANWEPVLYPRG